MLRRTCHTRAAEAIERRGRYDGPVAMARKSKAAVNIGIEGSPGHFAKLASTESVRYPAPCIIRGPSSEVAG